MHTTALTVAPTIALQNFPEPIAGLMLMIVVIGGLGLMAWRMILKAFRYGDRSDEKRRAFAVAILCVCVTLIIFASVLAVRFATMT